MILDFILSTVGTIGGLYTEEQRDLKKYLAAVSRGRRGDQLGSYWMTQLRNNDLDQGGDYDNSLWAEILWLAFSLSV